MSIYTRTGDQGQTSLLGGKRLDKDAARVETYGTLDELNSVLGLALSFCRSQRAREILAELQNELFEAGTDLASSGGPAHANMRRVAKEDWQRLELLIDELQEKLPPLKNFILPGGTPGAAFIHLGRSVCRRAERLVVSLRKQESEVNAEVLIYLNRLSDLLFVLARYENFSEGSAEVVWKTRP